MVKMVKTKINGKYEIILPEHRAKRPQYHSKQGWERKRLDSLHKHLKKGDVLYYVGAEEGEMPALCQMWGAEVVMFEPNPKVWANIKAIWESNKLTPPLATFFGFVSNKTDLSPHEPWKENPFNDFGLFPNVAHQEVIANHGFKELYLEADNYPQTKIDDIVKKVKPPTAMSIDVEGSEFEVLKGAEQTLKEYKPKIWLSLHPEFLFDQWGVYGREVRDWIIDRGYKETLLDYQHEVHLYYE